MTYTHLQASEEAEQSLLDQAAGPDWAEGAPDSEEAEQPLLDQAAGPEWTEGAPESSGLSKQMLTEHLPAPPTSNSSQW